MKKFIKCLVFFIMFSCLAACGSKNSGGGASGGDYATDMVSSIDALGNLLNNTRASIDECFSVSPTEIKCDCPGGGTLTLIEGANSTGTFTFEECIDGMGQLFDGEMSFTEDQITTFNFDQAAFCRDINDTANGDDCTGTLEGTCGGAVLTCTFQRSSSGNCLCL